MLIITKGINEWLLELFLPLWSSESGTQKSSRNTEWLKISGFNFCTKTFSKYWEKKCQPVHTHTLFKSTLCAIKQNMKLCRIQTFLNGAAIMKLSCICSLIETYSADSWGRELSPTWAWYGNPRMFSSPTAQFEELGPNICFLCWRNCCGKTHWCIVSSFFFFMSLCLFRFICE